ncbi:unnamed protein product [marine sediment metagenome]|uniref:Dehydrogenase E1 component domain-containing protein n=1 Tax=marine sediment metagenome TaxID=412755 RepID=X1E7Z2_9ZZZZ
MGDPGRLYRLEKETKEWMARCPIKTFRERLVEGEISSEEELSLIEKDTKKIIKEAVDFAIQSPYPDENEVYKNLFVEEEGVEAR